MAPFIGGAALLRGAVGGGTVRRRVCRAPVLAAMRAVEVPVAEVLAKQQQASASSRPTAPVWRAGDRACHVGDRACYAGDRACYAGDRACHASCA